jgi:antitoxin (DNA-binding transcriptional repressor) of toxin-antitoxin stability system
MAVIRISEAEASRDFAGVLARVREGAEVIIEDSTSSAVALHAIEPPLRCLSESLRLAKEHAVRTTLDGGLANDLEAIVNSHPEPLRNPWD